MTKELYINNELVDLPKDVIALSFAVNTLNEVKSLNGNISNKINLPPTRKNMRILGFVGSLNVDLTKTIRKKLTCRYLQNGVEIIPAGVVQVGSLTSKGLGIFITSGNIDFFDLIDKSINILDLSAYDHKFDFNDVPASRFNRTGYVYPIINYGDLNEASTSVNVKNMRPATFVKTVIDNIVSETGFKLINELETHPRTADRYARLILPFSNDKFEHSDRVVAALRANILIAKQTQSKYYRYADATSTVGSFHYVSFPFNSLDDASASWTPNKYTSKKRMIVEISLTLPKTTTVYLGAASGNTFDVRIIKNGAVLNKIAFEPPVGATDPFPQSRVFYNTSVVIPDVQLEVGDTIEVNIEFTSDRREMLIEPVATLKIAPSISEIKFGDNVELEATLPDIPKKDFLKAIANLFCAIIQTDNQAKTVRIVPFVKILDNVPKHVDWSSRVVNMDEETTDVSIGDYGQTNVATYENDEAISPELYASGSLNIADENLDLTNELFVLPFSSSVDTTAISGLQMILIDKIENTGETTFATSTEPRIAMIDFIDGVSVTLKDPATPLFSYIITESAPFTYFDGLGLRAGLMLQEIINTQYPELAKVLNDQRKKIVPMLLDEIDIQQLDFFTPVYLEQYSCYFYISKISNYVAVKPCNVELIKLY